MQEEVRQENKMGVMPITKLIITMSLPIMASMLVQALYNIVDSIFVAQISENALTAVSMAFPIQNLMIAVGTGTGVGINALLSRNLGAKNYKQVNKIASGILPEKAAGTINKGANNLDAVSKLGICFIRLSLSFKYLKQFLISSLYFL